MSTTFCHCDSAISSAGEALAMPALFTARLSEPRSVSVWVTAALRLARSVTSPGTAIDFRPSSVTAAACSSRPGQDQHSLRQAEDFLELGADHDDRHALSGESHDHVVDRLPGADVDAAGRLVEDHDLGFAFQPLGDDDLLLVATGQCPGRLFDP